MSECTPCPGDLSDERWARPATTMPTHARAEIYEWPGIAPDQAGVGPLLSVSHDASRAG